MRKKNINKNETNQEQFTKPKSFDPLNAFDLNDILDKTLSISNEINISLIDPDPDQPRKSFTNLQSLADSIKERGVISPISVRKKDDGRYLINYGERRYRAAIMAGLETIPAFIDDKHDEYDQMIENIQRENLSLEEISDFIVKKVEDGEAKGDIAKKLGKSNAYVTQYYSFYELPSLLKDLYRAERCTDLTTLIDLHKLYKTNKNDVIEWLDHASTITRALLKDFKTYLRDKQAVSDEVEANEDNVDEVYEAMSKTEDIVAETYDEIRMNSDAVTEVNDEVVVDEDDIDQVYDAVSKNEEIITEVYNEVSKNADNVTKVHDEFVINENNVAEVYDEVSKDDSIKISYANQIVFLNSKPLLKIIDESKLDIDALVENLKFLLK